MKHCHICKVDVEDGKYCPLCYNQLENCADSKAVVPFYKHKDKNETFEKKSYFLLRLFLFLSIASVGTCVFINILTKGSAWSVLVVLSVLYMWVLISHTIMSRRSVFEKILFQVLNIIAILVSSNHLAGGGKWLINFVLPSVAIITTSVLILISLISRRRRSQFLLSFLAIYVLSMVMSIVLLACKYDTFKILNQINMFYSILTIVGTLLLGYRIIKNESRKKLHL